MSVFFTADTHFGHYNIIRHCNRPFTTAQEMDDCIIERWNSRIGKKDTVFHLGDLSFSRGSKWAIQTIGKLNGNIHIVRGNHDCKCGNWPVKSISEMRSININRGTIILCHYALRVWDRKHHGSWHLYGHSHGRLPEDEQSMCFDVGVDCWDFAPLSFAQVVERMELKREKVPVRVSTSVDPIIGLRHGSEYYG